MREVRSEVLSRVRSIGSTLLVLTLVLSLPGCGEPTAVTDDDTSAKPAAIADEESLSESEIQALEALGYVESATVEDDEKESGVVARTDACECDGYLLVTYPPLRRAELMDRDGNVLQTWNNPADKNWERATFTPDGDVLVVGHETISKADGEKDEVNQRLLSRLGWDGELQWRRQLPVHHLARALPDGRILTLTSRPRSLPELAETFGRQTMADNGVALMSPDAKEVLEERSIYDVLASRADLFRFRVERLDNDAPSADFLHINYAQWLPGGELAQESPLFDAGNVLVTVRKQDTVAIFDFARGELLWAWGQGEIVGIHDAQLVDGGRVLIFDNRSRSSEEAGDGWSRIVEVDPRTDEIVWQYRADPPENFYSHSRGTVRRLAGGNTLIASSNQGRIFEVTRNGEIAWDYRTPHKWGKTTRSVLRAEVYSRKFVDRLLAR